VTSPTPLQRLEALQQARSLLAAGWCRGVLAKDRWGCNLSPLCDDAVYFCADGALLRACGAYNTPLYDEVACDLEKAVAPSALTFVGINDELGKEAILKVFDKAIERVTAECA